MLASPQMTLSLLRYKCLLFLDHVAIQASHSPEHVALSSLQVLLFSMPCLEDLYSQCCNLSKDGQMQKEAVHPTTLLKVRTSELTGRPMKLLNCCRSLKKTRMDSLLSKGKTPQVN